MVVTKQQTESLAVVPPLILSLSAHTNPNCRNDINPNYDHYYLVMIPIVLPLSHTKSIPIVDGVKKNTSDSEIPMFMVMLVNNCFPMGLNPIFF